MRAQSADAGPLDRGGDISVVIVEYRSPEALAECLESFERHRPNRVLEVIVIDNGEEPGTSSPAEGLPWVTWVRNEQNVHFRKGVNQGARLARGRYLFLLNPDAYLTDGDAPRLLAEMLDTDPGIGLVGPKMRGDDGLLAPQGERLSGLPDLIAAKTYLNAVWPDNPLARRRMRAGVSREHSAGVETLSAAALLCRREEFLAVGGLDERALMYWEEQELARKLRRRGLHAFYRADAFVFHHWRKGGTQAAAPGELTTLFEESMRLHYRQSYGLAGQALYDVLTVVQRLAAVARRRLKTSR